MKFSLSHFKGVRKGFTLIELMVSLALFAIVMTMAASAMLTILDANAKSQSGSAVMTNLNIALDSMTREIRTGTNYTCGEGHSTDCEGATSFQFITQEGRRVEYAFNVASSSITKMYLDDPTPIAVSITAPEVTVNNLVFNGRGFDTYESDGDLDQPFLQIIVQGEAGVKEKLKSEFDVQTSVSERLLDSR